MGEQKKEREYNRVVPHSLWQSEFIFLLLEPVLDSFSWALWLGDIGGEKNGKVTTNSSVIQFACYFSESSNSFSVYSMQILFSAEHRVTVIYSILYRLDSWYSLKLWKCNDTYLYFNYPTHLVCWISFPFPSKAWYHIKMQNPGEMEIKYQIFQYFTNPIWFEKKKVNWLHQR